MSTTKMTMDNQQMELTDVKNNLSSIHLLISFKKLCIVTASLPLVTLLICFVTAYIFQADEIHETHCRVYNVLPSISAVTGVSPQRYLWRIGIALHIGPRLIIATVYHAYYREVLKTFDDLPKKIIGSRVLNLCFWLNIAEIAALCGVTYVSNKENYYAHEKIFIMFLVTSLTYMLAAVKLGRLATPNAQSLYYKEILFATSLVSTVGLIIFFLKHRLLCHDLAFSWFSLCEYVIATANIGFHVTVIMDFPKEQLIVGRDLLATKVD